MTLMRSSQPRALTRMEIDGGNPVLPREVITSILIRLPVKALIRFQCVCKEWKNLFKTSSFIAEHLQHSTHQNPSLIFEDYGIPDPFRVCLLDSEMRVLEVQSDPFFDSKRCVWTINSCNGLICLGIVNVPRSLSLLVWNPATRETRLVSELVDGCVDRTLHVGFGFSQTVNDYKIVKICDSENDFLVNEVEVYSLNRGTWKEVEFGKLDGVGMISGGFAFNGAIFWVGLKLAVDEDEDDIDIIVSFDIATEVFTLIPMPPLPSPVISASDRKYLTVYGNKLALLSHTVSEDFKSSLIHLWVMEKGTCASRERWCCTKKYTSSPYLGCRLGYMLVPVTIWRNEVVCNVTEMPSDDLIGDEGEPDDERRIVMFNITTNEFRTLDIRKFILGYGIFNYSESLVPVGNMHVEQLCF
ncbi:putative F-box protein At3g10430 [Neltuma alba]|uniref:putative F-box protein At3g10430 n=1 Tax=Neltuma alba TaxID=207710 RepID=UPI0010A57DFF|nr:putative F-box protein At3g10430 [Prosopis alba]